MNRFIQKIVLYAAVVFGGMIIVFGTAGPLSAGDCIDINGMNSESHNGRRPFVCFEHDTHNEKAGIEDCAVCHHVHDESGNLKEGESSEGQACSECHAGGVSKREDDFSLISKYHTLCRDCHLEKKKGPVVCGECHKKAH